MFLEEEAPALMQALPFNDLMKKFRMEDRR
jgi:hypothetical protein